VSALDRRSFFDDIDLGAGQTVIAAVSGGSDSLALLLLLNTHLKTLAAPPRLLAVTVDHGLRESSATEAAGVAELCRQLGIDHRTLHWTGEKPATGIAAAAREARYRLLMEAAEGEGARMILTGHTLDDQVETVAMRRERSGQSSRGLSGMSLATLCDGRIWLMRPLLKVRRQALRDYLVAHGVSWIDDPTNADLRHERPRVRNDLARGSESFGRLARLAEEAANERAGRAQAAAGLLRRAGSMPAPGLWRLDVAVLRDAPFETSLLAVRASVACAGGMTHFPRVEACAERLRSAFIAPLRATLSRALIERRGDALWLCRERRGIGALDLSGQSQLWDGRWRVSFAGHGDGWGLACRPQDLAVPAEYMPDDLPRRMLASARHAEPWLIKDGRPVCAATDPAALELGLEARPVAAPFCRFTSGFDLPLAEALSAICGADDLPASPWRNHNGV
jgi:tRNA(Ile)-lysidine synthase